MCDESGTANGGKALEFPHLCRYFSELSPQPMVSVEGTTHLVRHVNEAFARLVGKNRTELLGRPFAEAVPEGNNNGCLALLGRVYRTGTPENLVEQQHGQMPPAYWTYVVWAVLGFDDHPAGVIIQVTDVTETAIFRRQLTDINQTLVCSSVRQHELTEVAEKLNVSLRASEDSLADLHRRKDEFLAMLSHELRNPLAPIANAVQLLRLQGNESPLQQQARSIIERQVNQLARLVDDLMEVSRITTGRVHLRNEQVVMNSIVERAVETARPLIDRHNHEFTVSLSSVPIWLHADTARLEQVIVNLLTNAAKYTADGGRISLSVQQVGDECVLLVRDTGVGIAPELLPRIFDLFTQAERSLDRSQGGLGIGLALVHRLVELHGGRVEVNSSLGRGSDFVVRLPVAIPAAPQSASTGTEAAPQSGPSLRVLVVDDNVDTAESLALLLKALGHDVRTAHTGTTALAAAIDYNPNVVLLDIGLPELDGFQVAQLIRQQLAHKNTVLVAMTGYGQEADRQRSQEAGFDHHLVKPADFKNVRQILASVSTSPSQ
jgi:signal transduction histidine kinase/CheY-like chemotaxis protein